MSVFHSLDVVMALLRGRARRDVNKTIRGYRQTPLFCAVKHGHADVALALVRAGGDVDLADAQGAGSRKRLFCVSSIAVCYTSASFEENVSHQSFVSYKYQSFVTFGAAKLNAYDSRQFVCPLCPACSCIGAFFCVSNCWDGNGY